MIKDKKKECLLKANMLVDREIQHLRNFLMELEYKSPEELCT